MAEAKNRFDPVTVIISNVPGPNHPLYSAGAELKHFHPVSTISDGIGLNLTVRSYNGQLDFGFVGDRDLVPDLWLLVDLLHESMEELRKRTPSESSVTPARRHTAKKPTPAKKPTAKRIPKEAAARKTAPTKPAAPGLSRDAGVAAHVNNAGCRATQ